MNMKRIAGSIVAGTLLLFPLASRAADSPGVFLDDSVITTKIKAELAEEKLSSLVKIEVDTKNHGMVTLTGSARSQKAVDRAVAIAHAVKGVNAVDSRVVVVADK
jgi:hyperosmotically inducible periplasmic protein